MYWGVKGMNNLSIGDKDIDRQCVVFDHGTLIGPVSPLIS